MPGFPIEDDYLLYDSRPEERRARRRRLQILVAALMAGFLLGRWSDSGGGGGSGAGTWAAALHGAALAEQEDLGDELYGPCETLRVVDGDTIDVDCGQFRDRVRLLRIDTPERGQAGYRQASEALADLLDGEDIYLGFENSERPERGVYGRLLAYVYADDRNVNVEMVRQGWSPFWTKYGAGRLSSAFSEAELEARAHGEGLWGR